MSISSDIISKYKLRRNSYNTGKNNAMDRYEQLVSKWEHRIGKGWYGFALENVPSSWYAAVDDYLSHYFQKHPEAEIYQIKLKFGGIRIYLSEYDDEDNLQIDNLERVMYDESLVW